MSEEIKNNICRLNNDLLLGTFCHIKTKNIYILLTNYTEDEFMLNKKLEYQIIGENEKKDIDMEKYRIKITDESLNISIIEILEEDKVSNFIEIDDDYNKAPKEYNNQDIKYIYQSKKGFNFCEGKIKEVSKEVHFIYKGNLTNHKGSPLILKSNSKLIGLSIGEKKALSIKTIINKINYIKCKHNIGKKNIGKKIKIINNGYNCIEGYSKDNMKDLLDMIIENEDDWKSKIKIKEEIKNKEIDKFKLIIDGKPSENELQYDHEFSEERLYTVYILFDSPINNLTYLFFECKCLQEVDFSCFNSDEITDMSYMFINCSSLKKVIFPENFNTSKVTNMNSMFCNCSSLVEIDIKSFDTENVINMACMFSGCTKLKKIITSKIEDLNDEVNNGRSKTTKERNSNNNENTMTYQNLVTKNNKIELTSKSINTKRNDDENNIEESQNIDNRSKSNEKYNALEKKIRLSKFNTSNVENMSCMFSECGSLEGEIDFSEFKTDNPKDMSFMFYKCKNLKIIKLLLNDNYKVDMKNMFNGCKCEEYYLGNPKIDKEKRNIFGIFEDIKYYHFKKCKFTKIECLKEELKDIIKIKKLLYLSNFILILLLIILIVVFIICPIISNNKNNN